MPFPNIPFFGSPGIEKPLTGAETDPDAYPNAEWNAVRLKYADANYYYSGDVLDEVVDAEATEPTLRYPARINLAASIVFLHTYAVMGEWTDDVIDWRGRSFSSGWQKNADPGYEFLAGMNSLSNMRSLYLRQILTQQIYGGMVFGVRYDPLLPTRARWVGIPPDFFYPVFSTMNNDLLEAIVGFKISKIEAERVWKVKTKEAWVDYQERWTGDEYEISIEGNAVNGGKPRGGVLPWVYVPRISPIGIPYGESVLRNTYGLQDEINARLGDIGDAVNRQTHGDVYVSNIPGGARSIRKHGRYVDLGTGWGNAKPEVHDVNTGEVPAGSREFVDGLLDFLRSTSHTPAVASGEDEGSQRSSVTLTARMWSLIQSARITRGMIEAGMSSLAEKTFRVAAASNVNVKRTDYYLPNFPPMLPKDRAEVVNEVVLLSSAGKISLERALELLDVPESERAEEIERIKALQKEEQEVQMALKAAAPAPDKGKGGEGKGDSAAPSKAAAAKKD